MGRALSSSAKLRPLPFCACVPLKAICTGATMDLPSGFNVSSRGALAEKS